MGSLGNRGSHRLWTTHAVMGHGNSDVQIWHSWMELTLCPLAYSSYGKRMAHPHLCSLPDFMVRRGNPLPELLTISSEWTSMFIHLTNSSDTRHVMKFRGVILFYQVYIIKDRTQGKHVAKLSTRFLGQQLTLFAQFFFLTVLGLRLCVLAFSSCGEQGRLSICSVWASHCSGLSCGAWALGQTSFRSCSLWAPECKISIWGSWT